MDEELEDDEELDDAPEDEESLPHAAISVESAAAPPAPPIIFRNFLREESSRASASSALSRETSGPAAVVTGMTSRSVGTSLPLRAPDRRGSSAGRVAAPRPRNDEGRRSRAGPRSCCGLSDRRYLTSTVAPASSSSPLSLSASS